MKYLPHIALFVLFVQSCRCDSSDEDSESGSNEAGRRRKPPRPCELDCKRIRNPRRRYCGSDGVTYASYCWLKAARCTNPGLISVHRFACRDPATTLKTTTTQTPTTLATRSRSRAPIETTTTERTSLSTLLSTATTVAARRPTTTAAPSPAGMTAGRETTTPMMSITSRERLTTTELPTTALNTDGVSTTQPFVVECPDTCPLIRELVCATDGVTYQSPCVLQLVACVRNDPTLMIASLGACPTSTMVPSTETSSVEPSTV